MKKSIILFLLAIITTCTLSSVDFPVELEDYFKDPFVIVNSGYICIWDRSLRVIQVYNADDMKKIACIDRKGQGPGEWQFFNSITLQGNSIYVGSFPKMIRFTIDGKLIKETRCGTNSGSFVPFGENYVGKSYPGSDWEPGTKIRFSLYDSDLELKKEMMLTTLDNNEGIKGRKRIDRIFYGTVQGMVYKDLYFIGTTEKGFYFAVFDTGGKLLYEIKKDYKKRPVLVSEKKKHISEFRKGVGEAMWNRIMAESDHIFADHYPPYERFAVADDMIYIFNTPFKGKRDLIILDLKGKHLVTKVFPVIKGLGAVSGGRFSIYNRKLYYIDEDLDEEVWKLKVINIKQLKNRGKTN